MKILFFSILFFAATKASAFDLEKFLRKNSKIDTLVTTMDKNKGGENQVAIKSLTDKIKELNAKEATGKYESKLDLVDYKEFKVNECPNCSTYLSLSDEVTEILMKMESLDEDTRDFVNYQANSVKFLSYQIRAEEQDQVRCKESFGMNTPTFSSLFENVTLAHSDVVDLPNFSSLQYVDADNNEIRFLYKINSHGKDQLVEMFIKEGKARVYYYDYNLRPDALKLTLAQEKSTLSRYWDDLKPVDNKFDFKIDNTKTFKSDHFNAHIKFDPDLVLRDDKIPTDLKIATVKTETKLSEKTSFHTSSAINLSEQSLEAVFKKDENDLLQINATHNDTSGQKLITVIPLKVSLNKEKGLSLNASLKNQEALVVADDKESRLSDQTVSLAIKDKNNRYVSLVLYNNNTTNYQSLLASNETKLNDRNTVSANYKTDTNGARDYSFSHSISFHRFGNLSTTYGIEKTSQEAKETDYFKVNHSMKVGKKSTLGLEAKTSQGEVATVMFKFQMKN